MLTDNKQQFTILNSLIQLAYPVIQLDGSTLYIYQYSTNMYFLMLYAPNKNKSYPFAIECVYLTTSAAVLNIQQTLNNVQIVYVKKQMNNPPATDYFYYITSIVPMSYTSIMIECTWNMHTQTNILEKFIYNPGQQLTIGLPNQSLSLIFTGSTTGSVGVVNYNKQNSLSQLFTLPTYSNGDQINHIYFCFKLGLFFVVARRDVYVFNAFTYQQVNQLTLQSINNDSDIIKLLFSEVQGFFLFYSKYQIQVYNTIQKQLYTLILTNTPTIQNMIYGCYIDDLYNRIFVHGDTLVSYSITLTNPIKYSTPTQSSYSQCVFFSKNAMCTMNGNEIEFFSRGATFNYLFTLKITTMTNFVLAGDEQYQYLYVYQSMIEVYSFAGVFQQSFTQMTMTIFQLQLSGLYYVAYTSAIAYIINRQSLVVSGSFVPSGASLIQGYYFSEINMIAYLTNEIRFGQIKFFSLDSFQPMGSLTNQFLVNQVGMAVKVSYDPDNQLINYIDQFGNQQSANYGAQINTYDMIAVPQMQNQLTGIPTDYILNLDMNDIYISNQQAIWRVSYNILLKIFKNTEKSSKKLYIQMNTLNDATNNNSSLVFVDNSNNIFTYQNYKITFVVNLSDDVQEMRVIYQHNTRFNLIVQTTQIIVFIGENVDYSNLSNSVSIPNIRIRSFLYADNGYAIIQTVENTVIDYDFYNNKPQNTFSFSQNCLMTAKTIYISSDLTKVFLYFSTNTGYVYSYDLINKVFSSYPLFVNTDMVTSFVLLSYPNVALLMQSGSIVEVDSRTFTILSPQNLNAVATAFANPVTEIKTSTIPFLYYDLLNNQYFLNIAEEKKLGVFKISDNSLITILAYPSSDRTTFNITNQFFILGNSFQLNFYSKSNYNYIGRFRKSTKQNNSISQIIEMLDYFFFIAESVAIETIYVNMQTNTIQLIDSIALTSPLIAYYTFINNQSIIKIIGISQLGVFEERLSIGLYQQQSQSSSSNTVLSCSSQISYNDIIQTQNDFNDIYIASSQAQVNFYLSVMVGSTIQQMNFLQHSNVQFILRPQNSAQNTLNIGATSFQSITSNVFMSSFNLQFTNQGQIINFQQSTQNVTLQNINIINQDLLLGTRINFQNQKIVQILNMQITNVNLQPNPSVQTSQSDQALFYFSNIQYILIDSLTIDNLKQNESCFMFLHADNVNQFVIRSLTIQNSYLTGNFFTLSSLTKLRIMNLSILDCTNSSSRRLLLPLQNSSFVPTYLLILNGIQVIQINDMIAENNVGIQFIYSNNAYSVQDFTLTLKNDTLLIQNSIFKGNIFPNDFNKDTQINLMDLSTTTATLQQITFQQNQGNIYVENINSIFLDNSNFSNNFGVLGAAIQFENILNSAIITNSKFSNNSAQASGGALHFLNVNSLTIDKKSIFTFNSALIGGAIRIITNTMTYLNSLQNLTTIQCQLSSNSATIFGKDIATYPTNIIVTQLDSSGSIVLYQKMSINNLSSNFEVQSLQSGGNVYFNIQLLDDSGQVFVIDQTLIQSNKYPQSVLSELQAYSFEIYSNPIDQLIEVKGESLISIKQYDTVSKSFQFQNIDLSANPQSEINSTSLIITMNNWHPSYQLDFILQFRQCIRGEVPVYTTPSIIFCQECTVGTYSLQTSTALTTETNCLKCPIGASKCQSDQITLKKGYWKLNNDTDVIVQCNQIIPDICDDTSPSSINGCIEGYIGPLCETCDTFGQVWKGRTYTMSFGNYICNKCSNDSLQYFYLIFLFLAVFIYLYWGIIIFMNNYVYNAQCTYIRLMRILPFSKSCVADESTFIIKMLFNFLQISQVLYQTNINVIPQIFSFIPSVVGQPVGKIIVSSQCLYNSIKHMFELDEEIKIRSLIYIFLPFFFLLTLFCILKIQIQFKLYKVNKYHYYVLISILFFFFQPDTIQFLTSTLTCRSVGDFRYVTTSLVLNCRDQSYLYFQYYAILPTLILWVIFPFLILLKFKKDTSNSSKLEYCTNKFKYGYFFLEYKQKFIYWEFIRVYVRIIIVFTSTLLMQLGYISLVLCMIILGVYISAIHILQPFQRALLGRLEIISIFTLNLNMFFYLFYNVYSNITFQIIISLLHYGFVLYLLFNVIKMKIISKKLCFKYKWLQNFIIKYLSKRLSQRILQRSQLKLQTLNRWKLIHKNLALLRQKKVEEFQYRVKQSQMQQDDIIENLDKYKMHVRQMSTPFKMYSQYANLVQNSSNTTICEQPTALYGSPFLQQKEPKVGYEQIKRLTQSGHTKSNSLNKLHTRQNSVEDHVKFQLTMRCPVTNMDTNNNELEELFPPNRIYDQKKNHECHNMFNN